MHLRPAGGGLLGLLLALRLRLLGDARRQALCDRIPPTCPAGWTATVAGACYGPCVPATNCAPMRCLGGVGCPSGWRCDDADNCVLAPR